MRILLLSHYYPPEVGAPQRRWDALAGRLTAGDDAARLHVIAPAPHYPGGRLLPEHAALAPGTTAPGRHGEVVHRVRFLPYDRSLRKRGLDQVIAAADAVRVALRHYGRRRPDVVLATVPGLPTAVAGLVVGALLRRPVVLELRDAWPDLLSHRHEWDGDAAPGAAQDTERRPGSKDLVASAVHHGLTWCQRRAAAVVTTTESFAAILRGRGVGRVTAIRTGTAQRPLPPATEHDGPLRILYLGTVGRSQDLGTAVRAVAALREEGVEAVLRVVGEGAMLADAGVLAARLGAPVELRGPVPPEQAAEQYAWCDTALVCLRPWTPMEWTLPSKLVEALATGRHVTGVLAGEAAAILAESGAGAVVPPGDVEALTRTWRELAADRSRLRVGDAGPAWVSAHADEGELAERYRLLLRSVVA